MIEYDRRRKQFVLKIVRGRSRPDFSYERAAANPGNEGALDEFLELDGALQKPDEKAIVKFIKKWGVLNLCEKHELPCTHRPKTRETPCGPSTVEPLAAWSRYVQEARSALESAVRVQEHRVRVPDWRAAELPLMEKRLEFREAAHKEADPAVWIMRKWLADSGLLLVPDYTYGAGFTVGFEHERRLFDLLTFQLLMAIIGAAGIGFCSVCGCPFTLERKRKPGQRVFCQKKSCQKKAAAMWVQDFRQKRAQRRARAKEK